MGLIGLIHLERSLEGAKETREVCPRKGWDGRPGCNGHLMALQGNWKGWRQRGGGVREVAALFCRRDSIYKTLPGVDVWDAERDARNWPGGMPAVCHPPCGQWGRLAHMAHENFAEKWLALLAVAWVRLFGGVLEHPRDTRIRSACKLPRPGQRDAWNGWTLVVSQKNWGHPAEKPTLLYVVGCEPRSIPDIPLELKQAERHQFVCPHDRRPNTIQLEQETMRGNPAPIRGVAGGARPKM